MDIIKIIATALLSVVALFIITKIMGHKLNPYRKRTEKNIIKKSLDFQGFLIFRYKKLKYKNTHRYRLI